jgi:Domain of unknown function (DUF4388)
MRVGEGAAHAAEAVSRFTGTLDDLSVADLIQILQLAGRGAVITITRGGLDSQLWCSAGAIIDAESGPLRGQVAVYRILSWEHGSMTAELRTEPRARSVHAPTPSLLLEAARRKDESVALRQKLGEDERWFRLDEGAGALPPQRNAAELVLLQSFAAARSLHDVLDSSELGDFETLTALVRWIDAGQLVDAGIRSEEPPAPPLEPRDAPQQALVSCSPVVATAIPSRSPRVPSASKRWVYNSLAAALLLPCGFVVGAAFADLLELRGAGPSSALASAAAAPAAPREYRLELRVEPAQAEVSLDGQAVGVGQVAAVLLRDGRVHELRAVAPGFVPARLLFVDVAPPVQLRLERLPAAPSDQTTSEVTAAEATAAASGEPASFAATPSATQKPRKPQLARARHEVERAPHPASHPASLPAASGASLAADEPRVQIIDGDAPAERVVN